MEEIIQQITTREKLGKIKTIQPVAGGSINLCYHVTTHSDEFFLKMNDNIPNDFFEVEFKGLSIVDQYARSPRTRSFGAIGDIKYLLMDWVPKDTVHPNALEDLAFSLSQLHRQTRDRFGMDFDNYIGRIPQQNAWQTSWFDFHREQRLLPLYKAAFDEGQLSREEMRKGEKLANRLHELIPDEKPALVHGDLWNGNYILSGSKAYLIDPAIYYGHREMDLAMTHLFGGFPDKFYTAYENGYKLEPGWKERIPVFQLYPLLVHLLIFGKNYHPAVKEVINNFA